ncbi:MAG: hypothetical protein ACRCY9_17490 [Phycicoccus sp.]
MTVIDWLLDSDPAIRWQVLRDLVDAPRDQVESERSHVATTGWGAALLALQDAEGTWDGGAYRPGWAQEDRPFFDAWTATHFTLRSLHEFGLDPSAEPARRAIARVRDGVRWEANGAPFFAGETEPCINGGVLATGAAFGEDMDALAETLATQALADGGWNCWAEFGASVSSFHSTLCVLEGLAEWERVGGSSDRVSAARAAGEAYLLERRLFRRLRDGAVVDPRFTMFSAPSRWYYDVLRALDYLRWARPERDPRLTEAIELVRSKRDENGRWPLENSHQGPTLIEMEGPDGFPSRWNTLRALRVLRWWDDDGPIAVDPPI